MCVCVCACGSNATKSTSIRFLTVGISVPGTRVQVLAKGQQIASNQKTQKRTPIHCTNITFSLLMETSSKFTELVINTSIHVWSQVAKTLKKKNFLMLMDNMVTWFKKYQKYFKKYTVLMNINTKILKCISKLNLAIYKNYIFIYT